MVGYAIKDWLTHPTIYPVLDLNHYNLKAQYLHYVWQKTVLSGRKLCFLAKNCAFWQKTVLFGKKTCFFGVPRLGSGLFLYFNHNKKHIKINNLTVIFSYK